MDAFSGCVSFWILVKELMSSGNFDLWDGNILLSGTVSDIASKDVQVLSIFQNTVKLKNIRRLKLASSFLILASLSSFHFDTFILF